MPDSLVKRFACEVGMSRPEDRLSRIVPTSTVPLRRLARDSIPARYSLCENSTSGCDRRLVRRFTRHDSSGGPVPYRLPVLSFHLERSGAYGSQRGHRWCRIASGAAALERLCPSRPRAQTFLCQAGTLHTLWIGRQSTNNRSNTVPTSACALLIIF